MLRSFTAAVLLGAGLLTACSPALNWRDVRATPSALKAMMPCKPDKAVRQVAMAGHQVDLEALGCNAEGATFAVLFADIGDAGRAGETLDQWKAATLARLRTAAPQELPFAPPGAVRLPQSLRVVASGQRADGSKVESQAAYFAQGRYVFQAMIYADRIRSEAAGPFFSGLRFE